MNKANDTKASRAKDVFGRVYDDFISQFARAEEKKGDRCCTPRGVVHLQSTGLKSARDHIRNWPMPTGKEECQR